MAPQWSFTMSLMHVEIIDLGIPHSSGMIDWSQKGLIARSERKLYWINLSALEMATMQNKGVCKGVQRCWSGFMTCAARVIYLTCVVFLFLVILLSDIVNSTIRLPIYEYFIKIYITLKGKFLFTFFRRDHDRRSYFKPIKSVKSTFWTSLWGLYHTKASSNCHLSSMLTMISQTIQLRISQSIHSSNRIARIYSGLGYKLKWHKGNLYIFNRPNGFLPQTELG